jgi:hypothetical protein
MNPDHDHSDGGAHQPGHEEFWETRTPCSLPYERCERSKDQTHRLIVWQGHDESGLPGFIGAHAAQLSDREWAEIERVHAGLLG